MSLLLWTVTLGGGGVSNKHCLLFLFSFLQGKVAVIHCSLICLIHFQKKINIISKVIDVSESNI